MKHKYDDRCACQQCTATWNKALLAAIDRGEKAKKRVKKRGNRG
jgi:hypothetical protein